MSDFIGYAVVAAIAGMIMFSAMNAKKGATEMSVATVQVRAGKKMTLDLAAALERDFRNVGSNFPAYDLPPDSAVIAWKTDSTDNFFQFIGQIVPDQPPVTIRYEWRVVDTTQVGGELKSLYQISRYVDGALLGQSAGVYTGVFFQVLTEAGLPAVDPAEVRQIDVKVIAISTLGSSGALGETRWNAVYRPVAIARDDAHDV